MMSGMQIVQDGVKKMIEVLVRSKRQKKMHRLHGVDIDTYNRDGVVILSSVDQTILDHLKNAEEIMIHIDWSKEEDA